jgi:hypothetical protein
LARSNEIKAIPSKSPRLIDVMDSPIEPALSKSQDGDEAAGQQEERDWEMREWGAKKIES